MPVSLSPQDLVEILETLGERFVVCRRGVRSRTLYESAALKQVMEEEPQRGQIQRVLEQMLAELCPSEESGAIPGATAGTTPLVREIRSARGRYSFRGSYIGASTSGLDVAVLITLSEVVTDPLSNETLQERFRLSGRECQIARLLARGRSNAEIAEELQISAHTVHHYTERILLKLGVRNRTEVAATILRI